MRVHAHVIVWMGEQLLVHRRTQRGSEYLTLPGGRVKDREGVADALEREVREEVGVAVEIGQLRLAAEVSGATRQELVLVFNGELQRVLDPPKVTLLDVEDPTAHRLMPPVLDRLDHAGGTWLGNLYDPGQTAP